MFCGPYFPRDWRSWKGVILPGRTENILVCRWVSVRPVMSVSVSSMNATPATRTFALSTAVLVCSFFYFSFTPKLTAHIVCIHWKCKFFMFLYSGSIETVWRTHQKQSGHATIRQGRIVQITVSQIRAVWGGVGLVVTCRLVFDVFWTVHHCDNWRIKTN